MFINFVATGIGGIALLLVCEGLIRKKHLKGENARKLVHICVAIYASTWAFYLNSRWIAFISVILVGAVIVAQKYDFMESMHTVRRVTYGEIWYPLGIGVSAILFTNPYIYALAVLHMGLADGLAAVVGVGMGKNAKRFHVLKQTKSVAGTLVFITTSFIMYFAYWVVWSSVPIFEYSIVNAVVISLSSAVIVATVEIFAPRGSDNILVPMSAGILAVLPTIQLII